MAISPDYWPAARADAPIHVQLRLTKRPDGVRADARVAGRVVRIFRDATERLKRGTRLSFVINCHDGRVRDESDLPPVLGKQSFALDLSWLAAARFLEVYLRPCGPREREGGYEVVWDQATALLHATKEPVNRADRDGYGVFVTEEVLRRAGTSASITPWWSKWWHRHVQTKPRPAS